MTIVVDDVQHTLEGAVVEVRRGDESGTIRLGALGDAVVEAALTALESALSEGASWPDALAAAARTPEIPGRCRRIELGNGALLLDDTLARTRHEVGRSLKVLADATRGRTRSLAVLGELYSEPAEWFDDHDGLGRLVVRLDVSQLIVVGHGARHTATAAGLEGSWDGESVLVADLDEAYAVLRSHLRPGDALLISAAARTPLADLVDRLIQEASW